MSDAPATPVRLGKNSEDANFAEALLDSIATGIIVIAGSGDIIAVNDAAMCSIGLRLKDALSGSIATLPAALRTVIEETLATGQPVVRQPVRMALGDGSDDLVRVTTALAIYTGSGTRSVLVEMQSISQAQSMAAHLEHLNRLGKVGITAAGIAHEIKNALVAVRTFVDLHAADCKDPELVRLVSQEIRRIDGVARQILHGATCEKPDRSPLSVHALLNDTLHMLRHQFELHGIQVTTKLAAPLDLIDGNDGQLHQALVNLLMNALEAMDGNGRLVVATNVVPVRERAHLRVTISDNGSGIQQEHLPRLFSPFFTTKTDGTGLGLSITRRIVQEHGGAILVDSNVKQGTNFHVLLPLLSPSPTNR